MFLLLEMLIPHIGEIRFLFNSVHDY